jgi:hypothetical protein
VAAVADGGADLVEPGTGRVDEEEGGPPVGCPEEGGHELLDGPPVVGEESELGGVLVGHRA